MPLEFEKVNKIIRIKQYFFTKKSGTRWANPVCIHSSIVGKISRNPRRRQLYLPASGLGTQRNRLFFPSYHPPPGWCKPPTFARGEGKKSDRQHLLPISVTLNFVWLGDAKPLFRIDSTRVGVSAPVGFWELLFIRLASYHMA